MASKSGNRFCGSDIRSQNKSKARTEPDLDRELSDLPPELRWREWMRRIEAVLFASASPVAREGLARVVGQGVSVDLLIEDLAADLEGRSFEVAKLAGGWMLRTRPAYAPAIRTGADLADQVLDLNEFDVAVLAAIAWHQPVTRDGLKDIFGKDISRDLIGRLHAQGLIATGPRSPRRGAPYTFVTTDQFLTAFGLETLRDLPDREQLNDAGLGRDQINHPAEDLREAYEDALAGTDRLQPGAAAGHRKDSSRARLISPHSALPSYARRTRVMA